MGTRYVTTALSALSRMLPFQFSDTQAYALEFGAFKMRPAALGGVELETGFKVTNITKAAAALVTCAYHGYKVGDEVYFNTIEGMTQINDRFLTVLTVPSVNTFTVNFDSRNAGTFLRDQTGVVNSAPVPPPPVVVPPPVVNPPPVVIPPPVGTGGDGGYGGDDYTGTGIDPIWVSPPREPGNPLGGAGVIP